MRAGKPFKYWQVLVLVGMNILLLVIWLIKY